MKQRMILIVSIVVGLVAALLTGQYLRAKDRDYQKKVDNLTRKYRPISIVVVNRYVPAGTVLAYSDLATMDMVESAVRGHAVKADDVNMLNGKKISRSLEKASPVFWSDIEGGDPFNKGLAHDIKNRQRAISINVGGSTAVSGMVRPNDHVDILATFTLPSATKASETEMVTLTLMQDVLVLATGRDTAKSQLNSADKSAGGYSSVTIEVTPREAEMLVFAEQARGRLVLTLRNPADTYFETDLPRVDFTKIKDEISDLNRIRQSQLLGRKYP
jgi:pilus assembly protein CpaB